MSLHTKAEFEAVKNNVQGQIDAYNNNLDNVVDGAIATYLSTVDIGGTSDAMFEKIKQKLNDGTLLGNLKIIGETAQTIQMTNMTIQGSTMPVINMKSGATKLETSGTGTATAFELSAANGSTKKTLKGQADGALSWDGSSASIGTQTKYSAIGSGTTAGFQMDAINGSTVKSLKGTADGNLSWNGTTWTGSSTTLGTQTRYSAIGSGTTAGFQIDAINGSTTRSLKGTADGNLTWNGAKIRTDAPSFLSGSCGNTGEKSANSNTKLCSLSLSTGYWVVVGACFGGWGGGFGYKTLGLTTGTTIGDNDVFAINCKDEYFHMLITGVYRCTSATTVNLVVRSENTYVINWGNIQAIKVG